MVRVFEPQNYKTAAINSGLKSTSDFVYLGQIRECVFMMFTGLAVGYFMTLPRLAMLRKFE
jgi:hypothetical protein